MNNNSSFLEIKTLDGARGAVLPLSLFPFVLLLYIIFRWICTSLCGVEISPKDPLRLAEMVHSIFMKRQQDSKWNIECESQLLGLKVLSDLVFTYSDFWRVTWQDVSSTHDLPSLAVVRPAAERGLSFGSMRRHTASRLNSRVANRRKGLCW